MWGQATFPSDEKKIMRIIPTRVGTSFTKRSQNYHIEDHPHACGDKPFFNSGQLGFIGSSPRVWGQGLRLQLLVTRYRIIPTRVGTSGMSFLRLITPRDHPHACGDKKKSYILSPIVTGSSPRVWGQVAEPIWEKYGLGIIPTRVGTRRS